MSGDRIGQWARFGLIRPSHFEGRPANLYAFYDVAEAIVVHWLRESGFKYKEIHSAIDHARALHPNWPLVEAPLGVAKVAADGDRGILALKLGSAYIDASGRGDQVSLRPQIFDRARLILRRGGWIADQLKLRKLEVDPDKLGGAPTLSGRRWQVDRIAQLAADEEGTQVLIRDYGIQRREIRESLRWVGAVAEL